MQYKKCVVKIVRKITKNVQYEQIFQHKKRILPLILKTLFLFFAQMF